MQNIRLYMGESGQELLASLKKDGRPETSTHLTVYRPWGSYQILARAERFQVKRIVVETNQAEWGWAMDPEDGGKWLTAEREEDKLALKVTKNITQAERTPVTVTIYAGKADPVSFTVRQQGIAFDAPGEG